MKPNESPAESAPEAASPFPPAFRWEASTQEAPTQFMGAVRWDPAQSDPAPSDPAQSDPAPSDPAQRDPAEATHVARTVGIGDSERTQVLRSTPSYQQRPGEAPDLFQPVDTPRDEPSGMPSDSSAPPWAASDPPPIAEQPIAEQQSAWLRQGPEMFQPHAMQSRSKQTIIGIAVLAVVVLGLVGATVAYSLTTGPGRAGNPQLAAPQPTAAPRELPAPPAPLPAPVDTAHALIDPPGQTRGGGGLFDLPQLKSTKLLQPPPIVNALQAGGMTDGVLKTTTVGSTTIGMFALTMPDQRAATMVAQTIVTTQLDGGLKADDNRALQGMMVMATVPGSQSTAYRAVYILYNRTIYVEVFGPDRTAVQDTFDSLIKQQVTYAPPIVQLGS